MYTAAAVMESLRACTTDQVTALFEPLYTVAVSVNDDPVFRAADGPTSVTVTVGAQTEYWQIGQRL